jgi:hypothetical protein
MLWRKEKCDYLVRAWIRSPYRSSQCTACDIPVPTTKCRLSTYFFKICKGFNFRHAVKSRISHVQPLDRQPETEEGNQHFSFLPSAFVSKALGF